MYLETQRTVIRDFCMEDVCGLQEIFGDAVTMKNVEPPYDVEKTRKFVREFCIEKSGAFAVEHKELGKLIGYILLKPFYEPDVFEISWIFHRAYWRQGYAYECCSKVISHAFSKMNAHKLIAEAIDPIKSVGLMKKLGMKQEGIERQQTRDLDGKWADLYFYGLLKEEYEGEPCSYHSI